MLLLQKQAEQMLPKEMVIFKKGISFCFTFSSADRIKISIRKFPLLVAYD